MVMKNEIEKLGRIIEGREDKKFRIYTVTSNRTWSFVHPATGMEIALITGKKRAKKLKSYLIKHGTDDYREMLALAKKWVAENPRRG